MRRRCFLAKMYPTYICQYPVLAVKGLIKYSPYIKIKPDAWLYFIWFSLFSSNMEKYLALHGTCKIATALQHIPTFVLITKYSSPVAGSVYFPCTSMLYLVYNRLCLPREDAMPLKTFCITGPLWGNPPVTSVSHHKGLIMRSFIARPKKLLK